MRTELYEQYKQKFPEELVQINKAFDFDRAVNVVRAQLREDKLAKVEKWRMILDGEDRGDS